MNWFQIAQAPLAKAFGWALLHSLWQSLIIYCCLRLILYFCRKASPVFRYHAALASLVAILGWFALTFIHELQLMPAANSDMAAIPLDLSVISAHDLAQQIKPVTATPSLTDQLQVIFPYLLALYSIGFLFFAARLGNDFYHLRKLRKNSYNVPDEAWLHYFDKLQKKLNINANAAFRLSERVVTPMMIGYLKPLVFLPACMMNNLTPEQIEAILLHELAHIKRNDYLVNLIQSFIELILFYNPFVYLISKRIREERELCCDEMVVAAQASPAVYASALVALEEYRQPFNHFSMAASGHKMKLIDRVKHIMEMQHTRLSITQRLIVFGLIAGSLSSIAWLNPSSVKPVEKAKDKVVNEIQSVDKLLPVLSPAPKQLMVADTTIFPKDSEKININIDTTFNINDNINVDNNDSLHINFNYDPKFDFKFDSAQWERVSKAQKDAMMQLKKIDWEKMKQQQEKAWEQMKKMNWDSLSEMQRKAMLQLKKVDWEKMQQQQAMAMAQMQKMDTSRMKKQMRQAMIMVQKINSDSMQRVMQKAMQKFNSDSMRLIINKAMADAQRFNNDSMQVIMAKARAEMIKAHRFMYAQSADALVSSMREDGLIKGDNYHIKLTDKALYINGKQQPAGIYKKYKAMTGGDTQLDINNANGKRSISIQQNNNK